MAASVGSDIASGWLIGGRIKLLHLSLSYEAKLELVDSLGELHQGILGKNGRLGSLMYSSR